MRFVYRILGRLGLLPRNPEPRGIAMLGDTIIDMESEIVAELALADAERNAQLDGYG